jgi:hypothetical protein
LRVLALPRREVHDGRSGRPEGGPMSKRIIAAIDDMLARLREAENLFPTAAVGDFFENPRYGPLRVRNDEVTTLYAVVRSEIVERYGADSAKLAILDSIRGSEPGADASLFRRHIDYLTNLRTFALAALPDD